MPSIDSPICNGIDCSQKDPSTGICHANNGKDDLPLMCVGPWVKSKHHYLIEYLNIFFQALKNNQKWGGRFIYIDLFSGPGRCVIQKTREEENGSPIIAADYEFYRYIFVDTSEKSLDVLKRRCQQLKNFKEMNFLPIDCNLSINNVIKLIPRYSLSFAFIDPFGLKFNFDTLKTMTENRQMDLLMHFPIMAIKRNLEIFSEKEESPLDYFLGTNSWRNKVTKLHSLSDKFRVIINCYKEQLESIGYSNLKDEYMDDKVQVKNTKNAPLYYLLFASKHPLGSKLWKIVKKYDADGQVSLPF